MPGFRPLSTLDVKTGDDAGDDWSAMIAFDAPTRLVSAETWTNAALLALSYDGTDVLDAMEIDPDRPMVFPFEARGFKIKNKETGLASRYEVKGGD